MVLRELKNISKILTLANAPMIETEISKIANSDARKRMWILIDGKRMPKDLAKEVGVTPMAVSNFLTALATADFVEYTQREPPSRKLNYIPPSWIGLIVKEKIDETSKNEEKKDENQGGEQK